jgi:hypothetical protein
MFSSTADPSGRAVQGVGLSPRLLRMWVRILPGTWMFFSCECCVLSGRGPCDELITRPEDSYRLLCIVVCDLETSRMRRPWPALGRSATKKKESFAQTVSYIRQYQTVQHTIKLIRNNVAKLKPQFG